MFNKFVTICFIFMLKFNKSDAILGPQLAYRELSARQMGRSIAQCFGQDEVGHCLENEMIAILNTAIKNNETWQLSDIISLEKNTINTPKDYDKLQNLSKKQRSLSDSLGVKLLQLAQSRALKIQLPTGLTALLDKRGISSGLDDFSVSAAQTFPKEEGRKKKDKDKNMAMMGGMAMMAMVAQMFLGKVILIAGAAFVMAKIALLVSVLGSLKKGSSGSSGNTEHVIVTAAGGGGGGGGAGGHSHEHSSGWHRSMPFKYNTMESPGTYHEIVDNDEEFKRRQSQTQFN